MEGETKARPRLIVLDDERSILALFESFANRYQYKIETYMDGVSALEAIRENPARADLLFVDIKMPRMDGITFAKKLREADVKLPIVFMTGYPSDDARKEILKLRYTLFLEKPLQIDKVFRETIPQALGLKPKGLRFE